MKHNHIISDRLNKSQLHISKKCMLVLSFLCLMCMCLICGCSTGKKTDDKKKEVGEQVKFTYENQKECNLWESKETMPYYDSTITSQAVTTIVPYIAENNVSGGCVIICPGGGYDHLTVEKEGTAPALELNNNGISAFVLNYRITPYHYEAILSDVFRAIRFVRYHAKDFKIDPDKISVMGFSAGGHLAAMSMEHYEEDKQKQDEVDSVSAKPDSAILCYPVISLKEYAHIRSRENFLGKENVTNDALLDQYSAQLHVTKDNPPVFIWHCKGDTGVPYQNSQMLADELTSAGVTCEYHLYNWGSHGLGLAKGQKEAGEWFPSCVTWLQKLGY